MPPDRAKDRRHGKQCPEHARRDASDEVDHNLTECRAQDEQGQAGQQAAAGEKGQEHYW